MTDWEPLIGPLSSGPRENGTPGLEAAADGLLATLRSFGLKADAVLWEAHPWRLRVAGFVALLVGLGYCALLWRKHARAALVLAIAGPVVLVTWLDVGVPLLDVAGSVTQRHVVATIAPAGAVKDRVLISAHYDTKTDLFDHVTRTPLTLATVPCALLMIVGALWSRLRKVALGASVFSGISYFLVSAGGAFVPARSPGAIDDGAGCATALALAQRFAAEPLPHTELTFVFFSGEEIGLEGSRAFVRAGHTPKGAQVINLDGVGAAADLALFKSESALLARYAYDPGLVARIDAEHRARRGKPLHHTFYSALTDARAFLEAGIPAVNLISDLPEHAIQRSLHSAGDTRDHVDPQALESTVELLTAVLRKEPLSPDSSSSR